MGSLIHAYYTHIFNDIKLQTDTRVFYMQRLDIAMEINDKANIGRSYCSIGNCLKAILQPDKAMECYKRVSRKCQTNS